MPRAKIKAALCLTASLFLLGGAPAPAPASGPAPAPPLGPLSTSERAAIISAVHQAPQQGFSVPLGPAEDDGALIAAAIAYAQAQHGLVHDPHAIDSAFSLKEPFDAVGEFQRARAQNSVGPWLQSQARTDPEYLALLSARERYARVVAEGGWPKIPAAAAATPAAKDRARIELGRRLALEGYDPGPVAGPEAKGAKGGALAAALADFQTHHGLKASGALDAATLEALNVSAADRLSAIDANLERDRWLPQSLPARRVMVDIAEPDVTLLDDGREVLRMRAVAGQPSRQTPTFAATITAAVFNPPWNVPGSIARSELFPKEHSHPGYFRRHGFYLSDGRLIQRAGASSSLGYIKFDVTDPFAVYLHDTPARSLFAKDRRFLSHGCVRLEKPRDLAMELLGWTSDQVDAAIAAKATHAVRLPSPVPVFLVYRTASAGADGKVAFRPDVYGWDAEIAAALAGHPRRRVQTEAPAAP